MADFPRFFRVRQTFPRPVVADLEDEVRGQLASLDLARRVKPGQTVAITAGSRGIANIPVILRAAASAMRDLKAEPFLVPAMGSHGGGTAEGQLRMLATLGITEASCGCPIRASMETVQLCTASEGFPVHFDRHAYEADHVLVCGRVKPHTGFVGDIESGLMKMMLIGLGKHAGAIIYHQAIQDYSFERIIRSVAGEVLTRCSVVAGLAIVENGYDETARIAALPPERFEECERELLELARQWMPRLPFPEAQVALIDRIGKNISGTGLDTNVVGRKFLDHRAADTETPKIKHLVVRSLTPETHGNATGIGLVEFCRSRVVREMDVRITRINCITGGHVTGAMIPVDYESDREILEAALAVNGLTPPVQARILWFHDTLDVAEVECSEAYYKEATDRDDLEIVCPPRDLPWDLEGNLPDSVHALR